MSSLRTEIRRHTVIRNIFRPITVLGIIGACISMSIKNYFLVVVSAILIAISGVVLSISEERARKIRDRMLGEG